MARIHLLGLPNAPVNESYCLDGFAQATLRFSRMMNCIGYEVMLYGAEGSNAQCSEFIQCVSEARRTALLGTAEYQYATDANCPDLWRQFNNTAAREIGLRKQPRDFICVLGGYGQKSVTDAHPELMDVEYSIGYPGSYARYRVYESHAWRHHTHGVQGMLDGHFFDAVIPLFFDAQKFEYRAEKENYALYVGRLTPRKGVGIACAAASAAGIPLKVIGHGDVSLVTHGAEYLGALDEQTRNDYMAGACALLCPTQYVEPFGSVAVEVQLCGTPVISTDFGGFTETVEHGRTGFRCNYLGEFVSALKACRCLDRAYIHARAVDTYGMRAVSRQYDAYFKRLGLLWDSGWNSLD